MTRNPFVALAAFIVGAIALFSLDGLRAEAAPVPGVTIQGKVQTIADGWVPVWITTCPQVIKIGSGVLGGVRNATAATSTITWSFFDEAVNGTTGANLVDAELPGLDPGKIVTLPFPGHAFVNGLVFNCSAALPSAAAGLPGPILVLVR